MPFLALNYRFKPECANLVNKHCEHGENIIIKCFKWFVQVMAVIF
jgi:hypothetical protein